jgi:hypothetical protein
MFKKIDLAFHFELAFFGVVLEVELTGVKFFFGVMRLLGRHYIT